MSTISYSNFFNPRFLPPKNTEGGLIINTDLDYNTLSEVCHLKGISCISIGNVGEHTLHRKNHDLTQLTIKCFQILSDI